MEADSALDALLRAPLEEEAAPDRVRLMWPAGEISDGRVRTNESHLLTDQRNWISGLHGGGRMVSEGTAAREDFPELEPDPAPEEVER